MLSDNDTDMSNATILDCPEISNATEDFLRSFAFWTEGIFLCGIGFPGKWMISVFQNLLFLVGNTAD